MVGAKSAWVACERLRINLENKESSITIGWLISALQDIESRFADHLRFIKLLIVQDDKAILFSGARELLDRTTADSFPSVWFDFEEAAKCLCLGRPTASVFHSMRLLEIAIRALAKRLNIADPTKSSERNWGIMLDKIRNKLDEVYPRNKRLVGTEGAFLEGIYASLDAVKNPWRNATMHVESVYTEQEAQHILSCTSVLLTKMANGFDENGLIIENSELPLGFPAKE